MPPFTLLTDDELLSSNDPEAFGVFYDRHVKALLGYFARRTFDAEEAADLTAEAFASALVARRRFKPGGPPATAWLFKIASRRLADYQRKGHVEQRMRRSLEMERRPVSDADAEMIRMLGDDAARSVLSELPPEQRRLVAAHVIDERPYGEIAGELHTSEAVVRKRVSRGLATMRRRTRKVVARVPVAGGAGRSASPDAFVIAGAGAVWVLAGDLQNGGAEGPVQLLRIDPRRNRVVARIPLTKPSGGTFSPQGVHVGEGVVWVIGAAGALQINPVSNTPQRYVPVTGAERGVVAGGDALWLLGLNGRLRQVDARSGRTVHTVRMPVSSGTHLGGGAPGQLSLVGDQRLTAFDPTNGRALWRAAFEAPLRSLAPGRGDTLWAFLDRTPERRDRLVRIDAGTGRRTGQVDVSDPGAAGLARVGRDLWLASPDGRITVVR
jgi:RNA polymerase sigma factor (sigma-70 family)